MKNVIGLLLGCFLITACEDDPNQPYLEVTGGGFIFNYRIGEAYYGFVAKPLRNIPDGTDIFAEFEDPSGGPKWLVKKEAKPNIIQYSFRTPGLKNVEKSKPYQVTITLIERETGRSLAKYHTSFSSSIDQEELPDKPLTTGPGYHPYQEKPQ